MPDKTNTELALEAYELCAKATLAVFKSHLAGTRARKRAMRHLIALLDSKDAGVWRGWQGSALVVGGRVEIRPSSALWGQGFKYGTIRKLDAGSGLVWVDMDGKVARDVWLGDPGDFRNHIDKVLGYDARPLAVGVRVQTHPCSDAWGNGDCYGRITRIYTSSDMTCVDALMDSGKELKGLSGGFRAKTAPGR